MPENSLLDPVFAGPREKFFSLPREQIFTRFVTIVTIGQLIFYIISYQLSVVSYQLLVYSYQLLFDRLYI